MLENLGYDKSSHSSSIVEERENFTAYNQNSYESVLKIASGLQTLFDHASENLSATIAQEIVKENSLKRCNQCKAQELEHRKLLKCSRCKKAFYCNTNCQKQHWPQHKNECKK